MPFNKLNRRALSGRNNFYDLEWLYISNKWKLTSHDDKAICNDFLIERWTNYNKV